MAPLVRRLHLFEIADQWWFPTRLRVLVQNALTQAWKTSTPPWALSPAHLAGDVLIRNLGRSLSTYTFVDFCAGSGGPTPHMERVVNAHLRSQGAQPINFVLTDLHPSLQTWRRISAGHPQITYESESIDAAIVPTSLIRKHGKVMRLFNLSFHHFDDVLARRIVKDTVNTSQGFVIFELPDRKLSACLSVLMLWIGTIFTAPHYAWKWRLPSMFIFSSLIPIIPFTLLFDGFVSQLRVRTAGEVDALLRSCGADTSEWVTKSGRERHLWPCGYLNWIICQRIPKQRV